MPPKKINDSELLNLVRAGNSRAQIAQKLDVGESAVCKCLKSFKLSILVNKEINHTSAKTSLETAQEAVAAALETLNSFEASFTTRGEKAQATLKENNIRLQQLSNELDAATISGDDEKIQAVESEIELLRASNTRLENVVRVMKGWRKREKVRLTELTAELVEAYQAELQVRYDSIQEKIGQIDEWKTEYLRGIGQIYRELREAAEIVKCGYKRVGRPFRKPDFRNPPMAQISIGQAEIEKKIGDSRVLPYWAGFQTYGKRLQAASTDEADQ